jgi:hypothetical protein
VTSSWIHDPALVRDKLAGLCDALGARAAGCWRLDLDEHRLVQVAFVPGAGLEPRIAEEFADATACVPLSQQSLGIVAAALSAHPVISRVAQLPADSGSGRWLRAFGASRSVAVPRRDDSATVQGVLSVALPEEVRESDDAIVAMLQHMLT